MKYISKGIVCNGSTEELLKISFYGQEIQLTGNNAAIWLNGRFKIAYAKNKLEENSLINLQRLGLIQVSDKERDDYWLLSKCILCPAKHSKFCLPLNRIEKTILLWLTKSGVRLSLAELIYLISNSVNPTDDLLYTQNGQKLIELIYSNENIEDNALERSMQNSEQCKVVVKSLLNLLRKKRILLL